MTRFMRCFNGIIRLYLFVWKEVFFRASGKHLIPKINLIFSLLFKYLKYLFEFSS